jgi:P-type Cu+ transporter
MLSQRPATSSSQSMASSSSQTQAFELDIEGMTCTACARRIEKNLNKLDGVSAYVDFTSEKAHITADPSVSKDTLVENVKDSGYSVGSDRSEITSLKWRVIVGIAFSIPVALTSMVPGWMLNMFLTAVLTLPVVTYVAWPFHVAALKNLRHLASTMDTLVSLGVLVAFGYSIFSLLSGDSHFYFEVAAVVPTVVQIGRWLEVRTRRSATDSVRALLSAIPESAKVRRDGVQVSIPTNQVQVGDLVVIAAGERIPVDGVAVEGVGVLDNSLITGESVPENVVAGIKVAAGSLNLSGAFVVQATSVTGNSRISQIADLVREATATKTKITSITDRISSVFVPSVIVLAILTYLFWAIVIGDNQHGLSAAIAVLVIACPCALGIAVPMSLAVATAEGAKRGIVIRNPDALSLLNKVDTVVLDKTGTLTDGRLQVHETIELGSVPLSEGLAIAAALERSSNHPIAKAISLLDSSKTASEVTETAGTGLTGKVDQIDYSIGLSEEFKFSNQLKLEAAMEKVGAASLAVLSRGNEALLLIALSDKVRPEAKQAISLMQSMGIEPVLLSGDVIRRVNDVALELGVTQWHARVSPESKLELINKLKQDGKTTAMVGDGLNDVAALTGADVGIAMGSGTHAAQSAAAVTILDDSPMGIPYALDLSRRTWRNIKQNLGWAFGYNVLLIPVAALGLLNPMLAGTAMASSSVSVVLNALRLKTR